MLPQAPHQASPRAPGSPAPPCSVPTPSRAPTQLEQPFARTQRPRALPLSSVTRPASMSPPPPGPLTALPRRLPYWCAQSQSLLSFTSHPSVSGEPGTRHLLPSPSPTAAARLPRSQLPTPHPRLAANSIPTPSGKSPPHSAPPQEAASSHSCQDLGVSLATLLPLTLLPVGDTLNTA